MDYIPPEDEKATCKIEVRAAGKDVPKSPFNLKLKPKAEPANIKMVGNPPKEVPCSVPQEFVIDTTEAGAGKLDVEVVVSAYLCSSFSNFHLIHLRISLTIISIRLPEPQR